MRHRTVGIRISLLNLAVFFLLLSDVILIVSGEFTISELIVDNLRRYNCSIQFDYEFHLIPKEAAALQLTFAPDHVIDFRQWKIPALPQLDVLEIDVSYVPQPLPTGLFSNMRRLDKLTIYHHLHTSFHFRTELNSMSFRDFYRLTALNLPSAGLESLPEVVLNGLQKLKVLDLNQNRLSTLPAGVFGSCCGELIWLNLAKNRFAEIPSYSLRNLPLLRQLNLYGNGITNLSAGAFSGLNSLTELNLDCNLLEDIASKAFGDLARLKKLYLEGNRIVNISSEIFEGLTGLEQLDLTNNRIISLRKGTFVSLRSLERLSLNRNRIGFIEPGAFDGLSQLVALELEANPIVNLDSNTLAGLGNLRELNMAAASIASLTYDAFVRTPFISELYLARNSLTSLPDGIFAASHDLRVLDISDNPWDCNCNLITIDSKTNRSEIRFENRIATLCASPDSIANASVFDLKTAIVENGTCIVYLPTFESSPPVTPFLSEEVPTTITEVPTTRVPSETIPELNNSERTTVVIVAFCVILTIVLIFAIVCILQPCRRTRRRGQWKVWERYRAKTSLPCYTVTKEAAPVRLALYSGIAKAAPDQEAPSPMLYSSVWFDCGGEGGV